MPDERTVAVAPAAPTNSSLSTLRVAGFLTLLFPVSLVFTVILGIAGYNDPPQWMMDLGQVGIWGLVLGVLAGFIAIFCGHASKGVPPRWAVARRLVLLAAYAEALSGVLVVLLVVGLIILLSNIHG
jgi:uncharacterized membrane protein